MKPPLHRADEDISSKMKKHAFPSRSSRSYSFLVHALRCRYGCGVEEDTEEAVRLLRLAATKGSSVALYHLGKCFLKGKGVRQDKVEAVRFFRLGTEAPCIQAELELGRCIFEGNGVERNQFEAFRTFKRLARAGSAEALAEVGISLFLGEGIRCSTR